MDDAKDYCFSTADHRLWHIEGFDVTTDETYHPGIEWVLKGPSGQTASLQSAVMTGYFDHPSDPEQLGDPVPNEVVEWAKRCISLLDGQGRFQW